MSITSKDSPPRLLSYLQNGPLCFRQDRCATTVEQIRTAHTLEPPLLIPQRTTFDEPSPTSAICIICISLFILNDRAAGQCSKDWNIAKLGTIAAQVRDQTRKDSKGMVRFDSLPYYATRPRCDSAEGSFEEKKDAWDAAQLIRV